MARWRDGGGGGVRVSVRLWAGAWAGRRGVYPPPTQVRRQLGGGVEGGEHQLCEHDGEIKQYQPDDCIMSLPTFQHLSHAALRQQGAQEGGPRQAASAGECGAAWKGTRHAACRVGSSAERGVGGGRRRGRRRGAAGSRTGASLIALMPSCRQAAGVLLPWLSSGLANPASQHHHHTCRLWKRLPHQVGCSERGGCNDSIRARCMASCHRPSSSPLERTPPRSSAGAARLAAAAVVAPPPPSLLAAPSGGPFSSSNPASSVSVLLVAWL